MIYVDLALVLMTVVDMVQSRRFIPGITFKIFTFTKEWALYLFQDIRLASEIQKKISYWLKLKT